jgi:UDP-galactopyranose mutase
MCSKVNSRGIVIVIVGAGLSEEIVTRELANKGYEVALINKRSHFTGNICDFLNEHCTRIHKFSRHLFHTRNKNVFELLSRFTE